MHATHRRLTSKRVILPAGLAGLIAAALVAGGGVSATADARPSPDRTAVQAQAALASGKAEKAIALTEAVVAAAPREAAYRALLGQAYLKAGRFESAAQAFAAAMTLGDNNARTALALALAQVGAGRQDEAVALLDDWRDAIAPVDLGLALALAGETGRGVAILADAVRSGENSPKARQNLAYAYALDGRWREARVMAAQDVPANQIDDRIGEWASRARPEDSRARVAALLAAPLRADSEQPAALALADDRGAENSAQTQLGMGNAADAELPAVTPGPAELPPVAVAEAAPAADLIPYRSVATAFVSRPVVQPVAAPRPATARAAAVAHSGAARPFAAQPVAQRAFASPKRAVRASPRIAKAALPGAAARAVRPAARPAASPGHGNGTHLVQLGAFASERDARRASARYLARTPQLKAYRVAITAAVVRGKHYWRVTAAGLDAGKAAGLCASLKAQGGACLAYAARAATVPAGRGSGAPLLAKIQPSGSKAQVGKHPAAHSVAGPANARRHR